MSYKNLILLKNSPKEVSFIECCEGSNALDFQLCTELGWRVHQDPEREFVVVTNDTGFDAVIKYWKQRHLAVRRIQGKACAAPKASSPAKATADAAAEAPAEMPEVQPAAEVAAPVMPEKQEGPAKAEPEAQPEQPAAPARQEPAPAAKSTEGNGVDDNAKEILYCVGKENLADLHEALTQIYGAKRALAIYNAFKSDTAYNNFLTKHEKLSPESKQKRYCEIVFSVAEPPVEMPEDFSVTVMKSWRQKKNLNSLRATLMNKYGKEKFGACYSAIKPHIKILDNIK